MNKKKDFALIALAQIISLIAGLLLLKLLTKNLSTASYGYYSLWMSVILFLRQIIFDPTSYILVKECGQSIKSRIVIAKQINIFHEIIKKLFILILFICFVSCLIVMVLLNNLDLIIVILAGSIYLFSNGVFGIYLAILNVIERRLLYGFFLASDSLLKLVVCGVLVVIFDGGLSGSVSAVSSSSLLLWVFSLMYLSSSFKINMSFNLRIMKSENDVKDVLIKTLGLYFPVFLVATKGASDRWIIAGLVGVEDLAAFSVLMQLGYAPIILLIGVLQTLVAPKIFMLCQLNGEYSKRELLKYLKSIFILIILISSIACFFAYNFAIWFLGTIVADEYLRYSQYFIFFVLSGSVAAIAGILNLVALGVMKSSDAGRTMTYSALIFIFVSTVMVFGFGFNGAVYGLLVGSLASLFIFIYKLFFVLNEIN